MDTTKADYEDLKYKTIQVYVSFNKLKDRILPPVVSKLLNPTQQLNLHIDSERLYHENGYLKKMKGWRSDGRLSKKDIKWFLSIPAYSLTWPGASFLQEHPEFFPTLRKYEKVHLILHDEFSNFEMDYSDLNHCNRIKSLTIQQSENFCVPILPSLTDLIIINDDNVDLTNLVHSLSLKKVMVTGCFNIVIPKELRERNVILEYIEEEPEEEEPEDSDFHRDEEDHGKQLDDNYNLYDEDEVTVYDEGTEDAEDESDDDEEEEEEEEENDDDNDDDDENEDEDEDENYDEDEIDGEDENDDNSEDD